MKKLDKIVELFPVWAIIVCLISFRFPELFVDLKSYISILLAIVMLGMGLTLRIENFKDIAKKPKPVIIGTILQYLIMPLSAYIISISLNLPKDIMIGLILVGCCPGGTASNVICYLAKCDVSLSIALTTISTIISFIATPILTLLYIGQVVSVPVNNIMITILQIILIPVGFGLIINHFYEKKLEKYKNVFPLLSMVSIVIIIGVITALNHDNIYKLSLLVVIAVILHNLSGFIISYFIAKKLNMSEITARTISIEVGMQNSGLGVVLALKYFNIIATLPGAIFSIWHNLAGSILAYIWSRKD
ncbi:MAG: bile acid:sodium symporter family protein [Vampirovibrionia bacterium]